jgi:hypothetical protein
MKNFIPQSNTNKKRRRNRSSNLSIATIRAMEEGNKIYENFKKASSTLKAYTVKEAFREMKSW